MEIEFWVTVTGWTGSGDAPGSIVTTPLGPAALTAASNSCRWVLSDCWLRGTTKTLAGASRVSNPSRNSRTRFRNRGVVEGFCWVERYRRWSQFMVVLLSARFTRNVTNPWGGANLCLQYNARTEDGSPSRKCVFFYSRKHGEG